MKYLNLFILFISLFSVVSAWTCRCGSTANPLDWGRTQNACGEKSSWKFETTREHCYNIKGSEKEKFGKACKKFKSGSYQCW